MSDSALDELARLLGAAQVDRRPDSLARAARSTLPDAVAPLAVVRAQDRDQVVAAVQWAGRHGIGLHAVSCGRNWGYGDRCPATTGQVILDLGAMNRIIAVDAQLAYAIIEPGVSQGQLAAYLAAHHPQLMCDASGAGPDASVLGNLIERGFGHSRYGDRLSHSADLEIVLGDGRIIHTGFGAWQGAHAAPVFRGGLGPSLDGLFTQSHLGILTRATVWLLPVPAAVRVGIITLDRREAGPELVEALRPLRLAGQLPCTLHLFNDLRLLGAVTRFPYDRLDGRRSLDLADPALLAELMRAHLLPAWAASLVLTGSRRVVAAQLADLKAVVRRVRGAKLIAMSPTMAKRLLGLLDGLQWLPGMAKQRDRLGKFELLARLQIGQPDHRSLLGGHWRGRQQPGADCDPLDSGAGMYWVSPVLPMNAEHMERVQALSRTVFHRHGFEYQVTFGMVSDRALCAVTTIPFDGASAEEGARARACHDELVAAAAAAGYYPYRGAAPTIAALRQHAPAHWALAEELGRACDPHGILAPSRYRIGATAKP
jgi:4-cresol dehydrogenase (hydroxylating)